MKRDDRSHNMSLDRLINIATDNITSKHTPHDYSPLPPTPSGYFLEFQNGGVPFLLLSGTTMVLL